MGCIFSNPQKDTFKAAFSDNFPCGCCICERSFNNTNNLLKHVGSHDLETINRYIKKQRRIVRCNVCNGKFGTVLQLKTHSCYMEYSSQS